MIWSSGFNPEGDQYRIFDLFNELTEAKLRAGSLEWWGRVGGG